LIGAIVTKVLDVTWLQNFINAAVQPDDLMFEKVAILAEGDTHEDGAGEERRIEHKKLLESEVARKVIAFRDQEFPLGFRNIKEITVLDPSALEFLLHYFSRIFFGEWHVFPQPIPRRGPGGYDGVVHAAMLRTGRSSSSRLTRRHCCGIRRTRPRRPSRTPSTNPT